MLSDEKYDGKRDGGSDWRQHLEQIGTHLVNDVVSYVAFLIVVVLAAATCWAIEEFSKRLPPDAGWIWWIIRFAEFGLLIASLAGILILSMVHIKRLVSHLRK